MQQQHCVAQVAQVDCFPQRTGDADLGERQNRQRAELIEIAEQLVHLEDQEALFRHGVEDSR